MIDISQDEATHELRRIASEESGLQSELFKKWILTLKDKPELEVIQVLTLRLDTIASELANQQAKFHELLKHLEETGQEPACDQDQMLRDMVGAYTWMFKISESICAHAGKNLYHLIENNELHERIASFQSKPAMEN